MRGKAIDDDVRSEVVAALLAGLGVRETARRCHLSHSVVSGIKANLGEQYDQVRPESRERIDDLILLNVTTFQKSLNAIANHVCKPEYLDKQSAADIATLFEKMSNTMLRILEAASLAGIEEPDE